MSSPHVNKEAALIDAHLLDGAPARAQLVELLVAQPPPSDAARPFYEGLRLLRGRTPELALIALRLVISGRRAGDETVGQLRRLVERVRAGGDDGAKARQEYEALLRDVL